MTQMSNCFDIEVWGRISNIDKPCWECYFDIQAGKKMNNKFWHSIKLGLNIEKQMADCYFDMQALRCSIQGRVSKKRGQNASLTFKLGPNIKTDAWNSKCCFDIPNGAENQQPAFKM